MENNISGESDKYRNSNGAIVFDNAEEEAIVATPIWKIVATYLVINGLIAKVLAVVNALFATYANVPLAVFLIWDFTTIALALWAGAFSAGKFVSQHFSIRDNKKKIVNTVFTYYVLFSIVAFFRLLQLSALALDGVDIIIIIVEAIFSLGLFYFLSKVYIKESNLNTPGHK